jgi:hypothetical protein
VDILKNDRRHDYKNVMMMKLKKMPKRQQVRKYITQKKGRTWEETGEVQLWKN